MIRDGDEPWICTKCDPAHAENCSECYGWGVKTDNDHAIAGDSVERFAAAGGWTRCPECGGTPFGREVSS